MVLINILLQAAGVIQEPKGQRSGYCMSGHWPGLMYIIYPHHHLLLLLLRLKITYPVFTPETLKKINIENYINI